MTGDRSQALIKDRSISWEMAGEVIGGQRCSCRATPGSCRCDLPTAEGRKGAAARGEGRSLYRDDRGVERSNLSRPSSQRDAAPFQRRNAARQGGSGSWFAPVGAASSATLLLRYSALKITTCLYLFYMVNKIKHSSTRQGQSVAGKMYTLLEFGTQHFL